MYAYVNYSIIGLSNALSLYKMQAFYFGGNLLTV